MNLTKQVAYSSSDVIKVYDNKGFHYEVEVRHFPHHGFSTACYLDRIIADCQLGRINQPFSDDDREWEMYEQRFSEWKDEILSNLKPLCTNHFNSQTE